MPKSISKEKSRPLKKTAKNKRDKNASKKRIKKDVKNNQETEIGYWGTNSTGPSGLVIN